MMLGLALALCGISIANAAETTYHLQKLDTPRDVLAVNENFRSLSGGLSKLDDDLQSQVDALSSNVTSGYASLAGPNSMTGNNSFTSTNSFSAYVAVSTRNDTGDTDRIIHNYYIGIATLPALATHGQDVFLGWTFACQWDNYQAWGRATIFRDGVDLDSTGYGIISQGAEDGVTGQMNMAGTYLDVAPSAGSHVYSVRFKQATVAAIGGYCYSSVTNGAARMFAKEQM